MVDETWGLARRGADKLHKMHNSKSICRLSEISKSKKLTAYETRSYEVRTMHTHLAVAFTGLLLFLTAACGTAPKGEKFGSDTYSQKDVRVGESGNYDVSVTIQREGAAEQAQCSLRQIEMKPSAGLHRRAWGYVRAYDYDCDGRFENLRFRYSDDQERASNAGERRMLENELWFAFGVVVPTDKQMR